MLWRVPRSLWPWRGQVSGSLLKSAGLTPHSPSTTGLRTRVWHKGSYDSLVSLPCTSLVFGAWTYLWDRNPPAELPWARRANVRTALASLKCNNCSGFCFTPAAWPAKPPCSHQTLPAPVSRPFYADLNLQQHLFPEEATRNTGPYDACSAGFPESTPIWMFHSEGLAGTLASLIILPCCLVGFFYRREIRFKQ